MEVEYKISAQGIYGGAAVDISTYQNSLIKGTLEKTVHRARSYRLNSVGACRYPAYLHLASLHNRTHGIYTKLC